MTVKELIMELAPFSGDTEIVTRDFENIESVYQVTLTHDNYPYGKPDNTVVVLD